ncbi:glycoside hydrolase family 15 protein [Xylophilus rhododendri]|uniref:Glycoside hydrolase family 15 protein n=1 Tax=Xylophilus rhododendri TaxID=2697032 RepID=A0A857JA56_9BURK|nr:glycoside hydrolase family 15 protein [Xylophilus rhododendri]QHJ00875.1 glycoside hydrolase family 15 protein [Xylophilus rhododendri]
MPLEQYGILGDGRAVALSGLDGAIDWWCVPNLDSPPLFNRLMDAEQGGVFAITPRGRFQSRQQYRRDSNVCETVFVTPTGTARIVESLNSGTAGRLPWAELARRVEGLEGWVEFELTIIFGRRADAASPYQSTIGKHSVFHVDRVLGVFVHGDAWQVERSDEGVRGSLRIEAGQRQLAAIVAGEDEPLVVPTVEDIDARIEISDQEWRRWTEGLKYGGPFRDEFRRSALALKLLLFSPTGAIAAAATSSLPEKIGGGKNFEYRYAWIRDAGYTVKAFLAAGANAEAKAAFTWLLKRMEEHGPQVCFTLHGQKVGPEQEIGVAGYRHSGPVRTGNLAAEQRQHGVFGDIFETASRFVDGGNILDASSAHLLARMADLCADSWRLKDHGIWELAEAEHYTNSKISCWQALARAVELADGGQLPTTCRDRWFRERDRIEAWIVENCWSEAKQSYVMYPGTEKLDASLALAVRFRFDGHDRLLGTVAALDRELSHGAFHYRYTGMREEEACFIACTFWIAEAHLLLDQEEAGTRMIRRAVDGLQAGNGVFSEMIDADTGAHLGNLPQGLSHLAHIMALDVMEQRARRETASARQSGA